MPFWQFFDYITEDNRNPLSDWYGTLKADEQAIFDLLVKQLSETEHWDAVKKKRGKYKELEREDAGLTQLMFETERKHLGQLFKKQFRPLGVWKKAEGLFIFFAGCEKHGILGTIPPNAFKEARRLKEQFDAERGTTREHIIH
jgi:hypothetical protein